MFNMSRLIKAKQGIIDDFVVKHKDVYDVVVQDPLTSQGEAGTGGALGPTEILLSALVPFVQQAQEELQGDLVVKMDGTTVGVEVKVSR